MTLHDRVRDLLARAGVTIDGDRPWDIQVHDERFYARMLAQGSLGVGESYMDGWWDCEQLDEFIARVLRADLRKAITPWKDALRVLGARLVNLQRPARAFRIGRHHYDIGNDLFRRMLDRRMIYSCGYWKAARTLDHAQEAKLELVCRKLELEPGMRVLDIGCGWGGTAQFAAERYGVSVLGITVSENQTTYARELCRGLEVEIRLEDYRRLQGTFDRVLSLGMFEHVGYKNHDRFMQVVRGLLTDDGLFLLHTIGATESGARLEPWTERYIFPNSMSPSAAQISTAIERKFVVEDWHSFGADYDTTLMHWYRNVEEHWPELRDRYDERFHRMWRFFLLSSAGGFRARKGQLWQIVLSPRGVPGGYRAPR
jgi:cyclopropane-fatty-acyl-phospholipid synthase